MAGFSLLTSLDFGRQITCIVQVRFAGAEIEGETAMESKAALWVSG